MVQEFSNTEDLRKIYVSNLISLKKCYSSSVIGCTENFRIFYMNTIILSGNLLMVTNSFCIWINQLLLVIRINYLLALSGNDVQRIFLLTKLCKHLLSRVALSSLAFHC